MSLAKVTVVGLFGVYKHVVELHPDDHITILHGPNGVGKTTLLRLIDEFFSGRLNALRRTPFDELSFDFTSGATVTVRTARPGGEDNTRPTRSIEVLLTPKSGRQPKPFTVSTPMARDLPISMIEDVVPFLDQVSPRQWLDEQTGRLLDLQAVLDLYGDLLPQRTQREPVPEWLTELVQSVDVYLIETQRLSQPMPKSRRYGPSRPARLRNVVDDIGDSIVVQTNAALAMYAAKSQEKDREFPRHVLEALRSSLNITDAAIRERYENQSKSRDRLISAGLIDQGEDIVLGADLTDTERSILWMYLGDVDEKLQVLYPFADKLDLFRDVLNGKFSATRKRVNVQRPSGLQVITERGEVLNLQDLSSGEQHELVLAYRLLFEVAAGSLVLIDEPELSLHVSWQQMFLPDLQEISAIANLDFIVATHSPTIIGDRWDLTSAMTISEE